MSAWFPASVDSESAVCDHCGSARERLLFMGSDRLHRLEGRFQVVECLDCGWLRQNPRPTAESIGYYYPPEYANFIRAIEDEPTQWRRWDRRYGMIKRRRAVERALWPMSRAVPGRHAAGGAQPDAQRRGRLLDVGCATGIFLHEMESAGWEVTGVEPSAEAAAYARQRLGLTVVQGMLHEVDLPSAGFDVVTLWDVFEHLHRPWTDLRRVHGLLRGGGLLVLRVPNLESLERRCFGPAWLGWDLPRHLYFVPQRALVASLEEIGFGVEGFRCVATSHFALVLSLRFWLEERFSPQALWPRRLLAALKSAPARLALAPLFWGLDQARASSMVTVFARKRATDTGRP